ncbi:hypothetical protein [Kitasatospora sp. NPDC056181]|uniref:hypothetical protein n=1 Tax=Kitasatospora sp. NPDC056181 TaxID=3345737 RepID=UPI0035DBEAF4
MWLGHRRSLGLRASPVTGIGRNTAFRVKVLDNGPALAGEEPADRAVHWWCRAYPGHTRAGYPPVALVVTDAGPVALANRQEAVAELPADCWRAATTVRLHSDGRSDLPRRRGLTGSRRVQEQLAALNAAQDQRRTRWIQAAPAGLAEAAADVARPSGRDRTDWSRGLRDAEERLAALTRLHHPEATERIRALLAWAGVPAREATGGLKWYDLAVQRQLLAEDPDLVLAAFAARPPSPAQLDGAAGLFSSTEWIEAHGRQLPEPLRSTLIGHIEADGTEPMRFRLRHGYYGAERTA